MILYFLQYFSFHVFCYNLGLQSLSPSTSFVTLVQFLHHLHFNFKFSFLLICLVASLISQKKNWLTKFVFSTFTFVLFMCFVLFTCVILLYVDPKFGIVMLKKNLSQV